jgi:hypothetical protein
MTIQNLCCKPFKANGETSMRWHSKLKHFEMTFEGYWIDASRADCRFKVYSFVKSLAARGYLQPVKQ